MLIGGGGVSEELFVWRRAFRKRWGLRRSQAEKGKDILGRRNAISESRGMSESLAC